MASRSECQRYRVRPGSTRRTQIDLVEPTSPRAREVAQRALEREVVAALHGAAGVAVLDHVAPRVAIVPAHPERAVAVAQAGPERERSNGHRFLLGLAVAAAFGSRFGRFAGILEPDRPVGEKPAHW
jgi:hypothetical protein